MVESCRNSRHRLSGRAKLDWLLLATMNDGFVPKSQPNNIGLCADCLHMRQIKSDRGSLFYMCQLSATDEKFPKYPRLPVLRCSGYQPSASKADRPTS
jgi:hypothetical protein